MRRFILALTFLLSTSTVFAAEPNPGPMILALRLVHREGKLDAIKPANDGKLKATLAKAFVKDGGLTEANAGGLFPSSVFARLAGGDGRLTAEEIASAMSTDVPASRERLVPKVRAYADRLTTSFDRIDATHRKAVDELVEFIVANYEPRKPLPAICICTANSRRSVLGMAMGNVAAAYYGLPEVRFSCGGTERSSVNSRAIRALKAIGVAIEPTGEHAPKGDPETPNPIYAIRWGTSGDPAFEAREFSKVYSDPHNPRNGFAALMVCSDADEACPLVKGASARISMPFFDPKVYDGTAYEEEKYDERRDDIGRVLLSALTQARRGLIESGKIKN